MRAVLTIEGALAARDARGGTAPAAVAVQLKEAEDQLAVQRAWATRTS